MKPQITAFLIDSDVKSTSQIVAALGSASAELRLLGAAGSLQEGMKVIQTSQPHIIVLEVKEVERGAREIEFLLSRCQQSAVFVTCAERSPEWILRLIRTGAKEYLTRPVSDSELLDAVRKVAKQQTVKSAPGGRSGQVISVYHPCGGMGATTVAVNLAATLAEQGKSTALVDLNLLSGDVCAFLDLTPRYTLASVTPKMGQVDASFLRSITVAHPCGVQVLSGPAHLGEASRIQPELLQEVVAVLQSVFDYTVIDTGGELFGCNLATFDRSDQILFTTVLNLPALRNAKRYLAALDDEGFGPGRVKLLVNRHNPRDEIRVMDAEKVLGTKAYHILPNSYADVRNSINRGEPLVQCYPKSPLTKAMVQLAGQLCLDGGPDL